MQIILLDDPPDMWAPSTVVAVKFQTFGEAQAFLCAEPSELQRLFDKRVLLNAVRMAKSKTEPSSDTGQYRSTLTDAMKSLLGEKEWARYSATYKIDPFFATVEDSEKGPVTIGPQGCHPEIPSISIGNKNRRVYYLSPSATAAINAFYYRLPEVALEEKDRVTNLDGQLAKLASSIKDTQIQIDACSTASGLLDQIAGQLQSGSGSAPLSASILLLVSDLRSNLTKANIDHDFSPWPNIGAAKDDLLDGSLTKAIHDKTDELTTTKVKLTTDYADSRAQREAASRMADLIAKSIIQDNQRIVGFIDEDQRVLYIANNLEALRRGAEQAATQTLDTVIPFSAERIRLYASADNTMQSVFDLWPDDSLVQQSDRWRTAKRDGTLLPFGVAFIGISGRNNSVIVSARIVRQPAKSAHP
jgi:hypothetical protein